MITVLFSSCGQNNNNISSTKDTNGVDNVINITANEKEMFVQILKDSNFTLLEKKRIDSLESPLRISKNFELFSLNDLGLVERRYERWSLNDDFVDAWIFNFSDLNDIVILESRIDNLCNTESVEKTIFQKNFRGYKFSGNSLLLIKHDFFSKEKITKHQKIIDFIKKDFTCW